MPPGPGHRYKRWICDRQRVETNQQGGVRSVLPKAFPIQGITGIIYLSHSHAGDVVDDPWQFMRLGTSSLSDTGSEIQRRWCCSESRADQFLCVSGEHKGVTDVLPSMSLTMAGEVEQCNSTKTITHHFLCFQRNTWCKAIRSYAAPTEFVNKIALTLWRMDRENND